MELQKRAFNVTLLFLVHFVFFVSVLCSESEEDPVVKYSHGAVKGKWLSTYSSGKRIRAFLGMPYATPPVEELRFKDPVKKVEPWGDNVRDAIKDANVCVQWKNKVLVGNEDCLYINVYTPEKVSTENPLPVLFFIHGGFLTSGSSNSSNYGPEILLEHDIILVTLNYRLGVLGFLTTGDREAKGNFGFKDQVAGLEWTKENIRSFGGNPEQVTIFGQSAGSTSISYHCHSPMSKGLFQRAMSFSSGSDSFRPPPREFAKRNTELLAGYVNCPTTPTPQMMKCLREKPIKDIFGQLEKFKVWRNQPIAIFRPTVETDLGLHDAFITEESLKSKSNMPLMIGYTSEDGYSVTNSLLNAPNSATPNALLDPIAVKEVNDRFNKIVPVLCRYDQYEDKDKLTAEAKKFYLKGTDINEENFLDFTHMSGDILYWRAMLSALRLHDGPAYLYYNTYKGAISLLDQFPHVGKVQGVSHGDELLLIFPMRSIGIHKIADSDKPVSDKFVSIIAAFVQYGEQFSTKTSINWEKVDLNKMNYLHIGNNEFKMKENMLGERTAFWMNWLDNSPK